jgi:hypothetical protein
MVAIVKAIKDDTVAERLYREYNERIYRRPPRGSSSTPTPNE